MAKRKRRKSIKRMGQELPGNPLDGTGTMPSSTNNIRNWRLFRKIEKQRTLADISKAFDPKGRGISRVNLLRLENGVARWNEDHIMILSRALGCTPGDLIDTNPFDNGDIFAVYARLTATDKKRALKGMMKAIGKQSK